MVQFTMLNSMADNDFIHSLDIQKSWGISVLDLKDGIFGKSLIDLTESDAEHAAEAIADRSMSVYCFSSELFHGDIELGEAYFQEHYLNRLIHLLKLARILKPSVIRLLSARSSKRHEIADSATYIQLEHPWLIPMYREAVDLFVEDGFQVTIENECYENLFSKPQEIVSFFKLLDRATKIHFTYDAQNLWQMGTFPTMEVYRELAPLIGFFHVKGGQQGDKGDKLVWSSGLKDASWPVEQMLRQVLADGVSSVICLNPSHGKQKPDYNYDGIYLKDLLYMKQIAQGGC